MFFLKRRKALVEKIINSGDKWQGLKPLIHSVPHTFMHYMKNKDTCWMDPVILRPVKHKNLKQKLFTDITFPRPVKHKIILIFDINYEHVS